MCDVVGDIYPEANVSVSPFKFAITLIRDCRYENMNEYAEIVFKPALLLRSFTWAP